MEKYKRCPQCGEKNAPSNLECENCDADLLSVQVESSESAHDSVKISETEQSEKPKRMVRICDCGRKNPVAARKCESCGEDISDITPQKEGTVQEGSCANQYCMLCSTDDSYSYSMTKSPIIIGRNHELSEYLANKMFVSREQAILSAENGHIYISNMSRSNPTYVNNCKIEDMPPTLLNNGDEIGLGGTSINGRTQNNAAYFYVRY